MKISIESAANGYIVRIPPDDPEFAEQVILVEESDRVTAAVRMLWEVNEAIGEVGGRHDAARVRISAPPGDKHHDLHPQLCAKCACHCDPDQSTGPLDLGTPVAPPASELEPNDAPDDHLSGLA